MAEHHAKRVSAFLLALLLAASPLAALAEESAEQSGGAAAAAEVSDGEGYISEIETLEVLLVSGAEQNSSGDYVWEPDDESAGHDFKFRVTFATSGTATLAAAETDGETADAPFEIRIPAHILTDKSGAYADSVTMSYPSMEEAQALTEEEIDAADGFAWYLDGDEIVVYNFKEISAAQSGYFEVSYETTEETFEYYDYGCTDSQTGGASEEFYAVLTAQAEEGTLEETAGGLRVYIDTGAELVSVYKADADLYTAWKSSWGTEPEDYEAYGYLLWAVRSNIADPTQYYDFNLTDENITYTVTYADGTTASGDLSDGGIAIVAYRMYEESFAAASDSTSLTVKRKTLDLDGYRYDYVLVALSSEVFADAVSFTVTNRASCVVTPVDGVDDATTGSDKNSFSWTQPAFVVPTGSINVFKYGNENYTDASSSLIRKSGSYISYDLGTLQSADADEDTSLEGIIYEVVSEGYPYAWTLADDWESREDYYTESSDGTKSPTYKAYGQEEVTYVISDDTLYPLNADGTSLEGEDLANNTGAESLDTYGQITAYENVDPLNSEDYDFVALEYTVTLKDAVRDEAGDPTLDEDSGYDVKTVDFSDGDELELAVKVDGEWLNAGTYNLGTDTWSADAEGGSYVESFTSDRIDFAEGVDGYQIAITNSYYYTKISMIPYLALYATDNVRAWTGIEDSEELPAQSVVLLRNAVRQNLYDAEEYETLTAAYGIAAAGDEDYSNFSEAAISELAKVIGDRIRSAKRSSSITKQVSSTENDTAASCIHVTWQISVSETISAGSGSTADYVTQYGGTFYDLLPYGAAFEQDSVLVQTQEGYLDEGDYEVEVTDNFRDSGRTMVTITVYAEGEYYNVWLTTDITWESLTDNGTYYLNVAAYETGNSSISSGSADDGGSLTEAYKSYMTGLDPDTDGARFLYVTRSVTLDAVTSAATGLIKKVKAEDDSAYSYDTTVAIGGTYSYQIRYENTSQTSSKDMIIYDSLENYSYEEEEEQKESSWQGTLTAVDTTQPEELGISPVVYISTIEDLDLSLAGNRDLGDTSIWTPVTDETDLSSARAVAVDMREDEDGEEVTLAAGGSAVITLYLKAPEEAVSDFDADGTALYAEAYNNTYMSLTSISESNVESSETIHHDHTTVRLAAEGDVYLEKVNSEDPDETISGITFLLSGTSDYGTEVSVEKITNVNGQITWTNLEMGTYTLQESGDYEDWITDHYAYTVTVDAAGNVTVDGQENSDTAYYVFENAPRLHGDVTFLKTDADSGNVLGEGFTFTLTGISDYGTEVSLTADSTAAGRVTFSNIEIGTYTMVETASDADHITADNITYTVVVEENGSVTITGENCTQNDAGTYKISNQAYFGFTLLKRSSYDNAPVTGVEFTLSGTTDLGHAYESVQTTGEDGAIVFWLEPGTYVLTETSAENADPEVIADDTPRTLVIGADGSVTVDGEELGVAASLTIYNEQIAQNTVTVTKKWVTDDTAALYDAAGSISLFPTFYLSTTLPEDD